MPDKGEEVAATMKDLREVETSLISLVDKRMYELRDLIAKLASVQASTPSASSAPVDNSSENVGKEDKEVEEGEGEEREVNLKMNFLRKIHLAKGKVRRRTTMRFLLQTTHLTHLFPILI